MDSMTISNIIFFCINHNHLASMVAKITMPMTNQMVVILRTLITKFIVCNTQVSRCRKKEHTHILTTNRKHLSIVL